MIRPQVAREKRNGQDSALSILEGEYLRDLRAQPQALADTVANLPNMAGLQEKVGACTKIVLTGMGSSLHALYPLQLRLVQHGRTTLLVETAELVHALAGLLDARTLVVAVSQSGRSAETLRLLDMIGPGQPRPFVIGVTNTADSPLAASADEALLLLAGQEFSVSCKTYVSTLVALEWLGGALCGDDLVEVRGELDEAAPAARAYLADWREHVAQLTGELSGVKHLFVTGRGSSLAAAGAGGLIVKESARFPAQGMSSPAFRHGPLEMIGEDVFVLVFAGDPATAPLNEFLVRDVCAAGGRATLVSEKADSAAFRLPKVPPRIRPVVEILPVQMISLALAALSGREPGRFERASKVTTIA